MLAHAGGAATLDAPPWLLAYGAAAVVLLVTVGLRGRAVVAASRPARAAGSSGSAGAGNGPGACPTAPVSDTGPAPRSGGWRTARRVAGRVIGIAALATVVMAAFAGPDVSAANFAPSAVLAVWWVGLPLACVVAGDVMRWLDPFGTVARPLARPRSRVRPGADAGRGPSWTGPLFLAAFAWWERAYHDARSPRSLGWFLVAYTAAAVAGAAVWGRRWLRHGEGFGALSTALTQARARAIGRGRAGTHDTTDPGARAAPAGGLVGLVAVWLGAVVFDLFSGTRAWVEIAGDSSGWARTGRASGCLLIAVVLAWTVVAGTIRVARRPAATAGSGPAIGRTVALAWLAATTGTFIAHGITLLLVDGQIALALASDPFARGWDLFGTAMRTIDYSPLSSGAIGAFQVAAAAGGAIWGVVVAARTVPTPGGSAADARTGLRVLWVMGVSLAGAAALAVAVLSADLE